MEIQQLKEVSKRHVPLTHKKKNAAFAFVSGGLLAVIFQALASWLMSSFNQSDAQTISLLLLIFMASILTGFGVYDDLAKICGAGLFVPISGFANALTASALECKHEGLIYGIGSNMFKLAGSVITYGIVSAIILSAIRYGVYLL